MHVENVFHILLRVKSYCYNYIFARKTVNQTVGTVLLYPSRDVFSHHNSIICVQTIRMMNDFLGAKKMV